MSIGIKQPGEFDRGFDAGFKVAKMEVGRVLDRAEALQWLLTDILRADCVTDDHRERAAELGVTGAEVER